MFRRCLKYFAPFISVNSPYETAASVKLPVMGVCPHFSVEKTEAQRGCDLPEGTFNIQSILYSINYFPCLASETPPSVGSKSPPWLLLPSIMFDCFFAFFSPLVLMSLSPHRHTAQTS